MPYSPKPRTSSSTRPCGLSEAHSIPLGGLDLIPDLSGALYVPDFNTLLVADLHLEKGSSLARRGVHLPPYDTRESLLQLRAVIEALRPRCVIFLGDSFHDGEARQRIGDDDLQLLRQLTFSQDTIWISGNHDPHPPRDVGGSVASEVSLGPLTLRHEPRALRHGEFEIAGHLHPAAAVAHRGLLLRCRCFAAGERRAVMPAFGSYTGALSVLAPPFAGLFGPSYFVWMLGNRSIHKFPSSRVR